MLLRGNIISLLFIFVDPFSSIVNSVHLREFPWDSTQRPGDVVIHLCYSRACVCELHRGWSVVDSVSGVSASAQKRQK